MGASLMIALGTAAAGASAATAVSAWLSARVRPTDSRLWHAVWTSVALASLAAPFASLVLPRWQFAIKLGPSAPFAASAGQWIDRLPLAADWSAVMFMAGTLVMTSRLLWGCGQALRIAREARPLECAERARIDRLVPGSGAMCRVHERLRVPVAIGWRLGVIVLPVSAAGWSDDRLHAIVVHEQQHVLRRDFLWNVAAEAQHAVYWWNPFARLVARRVRLTAELASDRDAAAADAAAYARHLVATAQELTHFASPHKILAPGAISDLEKRVDALLNDESGASRRPMSGRRIRMATALLAAVVVLAPMLVSARIERHPFASMHAAKHAQRHQH